MKLQIFLVALLVMLVALLAETEAAPQSAESQNVSTTAPASCPVTLPGSARAFGKHLRGNEAMSFFEQGTSGWKLFLGVGLWPDGTVVFRPGGAGFIEPDGSLAMKFGWLRDEVRGKLKIHGRRLDGPAPPLRADVPEGYGDTGGQPTMLIFPTQGCWEVTGSVGDISVTFVTRVVRLREQN
jgi:hypothetical protein